MDTTEERRPISDDDLAWIRNQATNAHENEAGSEWADEPIFGADEVLSVIARLDLAEAVVEAAEELHRGKREPGCHLCAALDAWHTGGGE